MESRGVEVDASGGETMEVEGWFGCVRESGKGGVVLQFDRGQTCKRSGLVTLGLVDQITKRAKGWVSI